jgi:hypothetical protein
MFMVAVAVIALGIVGVMSLLNAVERERAKARAKVYKLTLLRAVLPPLPLAPVPPQAK